MLQLLKPKYRTKISQEFMIHTKALFITVHVSVCITVNCDGSFFIWEAIFITLLSDCG